MRLQGKVSGKIYLIEETTPFFEGISEIFLKRFSKRVGPKIQMSVASSSVKM